MGAPYGSDARRMARRRQPVVDRGTNAAPLDRRIAAPMMTGDQEHDAIARVDGLLECPVDHVPGAVEIEAVQVDHSVRLDRP